MNKQLQKPQSFQEVATVGCIKEDIEWFLLGWVYRAWKSKKEKKLHNSSNRNEKEQD